MPGLTVIGNLSLDRVDGGAVRPGGCPSFAALALRMLDGDGTVLTRCAPADRPIFDMTLAGLGVPVTVIPAATTSAFGMHYTGEHRSMTVDAIGDTWTPAEVTDVAATTLWAHVAPLLRSDFTAETLAALADGECRVSFDGQGLVRVPQVGPLTLDADFDPAFLSHLQTLKLAEDEAAVLAAQGLDARAIVRLGVPEVLLTLGSEGSIVHAEGEERAIPAAWPVLGVQTTGAGDVFMVGYGAARSGGADAFEAAGRASELVAQMLERRRQEG